MAGRPARPSQSTEPPAQPSRELPDELPTNLPTRASRSRDDAGMSTAEYAIGTLAACGFAGVLWVVVHSGAVHGLIQGVIERALNLAP